jgi:AcrR family transcriptional regulator
MNQQSNRTPRLPAETRRRELLDAALDVISEQGFAALSVEAVAQGAGVTRPVVYDLFGDLDGLLIALIDREEERALGPMLGIVGDRPGDDVDPEQFLHDGTLAFLQAVHGNPRTWRLALMPPQGGSPEFRDRIAATRRLIAERVEALLEWGISKRGGPVGLDLELCARVIIAVAEDAARLTLLHPRRYPPELIAGVARQSLAMAPAHAKPRGAGPPAVFDTVQPPAPLEPPAPAKRMPQAQRREQLLDAALDVIADGGFDALSMEAIARRCDVNRVVVYRSFANMRLLQLALLHREDARTRAMLASLLPEDAAGRSAVDLLAETLARFLAAVTSAPRTYRVVLQRPESAPLMLQKMVNRRRADLAGRLRPLVEWGIADMDVPPGIDIDLICRLLLSSGEELARLALDDGAFPPRRILLGAWALLDQIPLRR